MDGNRFLDFNAGIAVVAAGHCHPQVVRAIQEQAACLVHMSGTDFYYENMVQLAETLARLAPGPSLAAFTSVTPVPRRSKLGLEFAATIRVATNLSPSSAVSTDALWARSP